MNNIILKLLIVLELLELFLKLSNLWLGFLNAKVDLSLKCSSLKLVIHLIIRHLRVDEHSSESDIGLDGYSVKAIYKFIYLVTRKVDSTIEQQKCKVTKNDRILVSKKEVNFKIFQ